MQIDGQCHCGAITYVAEVDPSEVVICHCTDCQALTGTAFRVSVPAHRESIEITGEPAVYVKIGGSGARRFQLFCRTCGSPLFSHGVDAEIWGVRWGGVRQREDLIPRRQIWRRSAPAWVCAFEDVPEAPQE